LSQINSLKTANQFSTSSSLQETRFNCPITAYFFRRLKILLGIAVIDLKNGKEKDKTDYDKADFDFLEQIEFPIVLKSTPKSGKFLEQKFGLSAAEAKKALGRIGNFTTGEALILHDKQPLFVELSK
jgi:hypothetical protein